MVVDTDVNLDHEKSATATCPTGKHPISGGYAESTGAHPTALFLSDASGNPATGDPATVGSSFNSWTAEDDSSKEGVLTVYVYCA